MEKSQISISDPLESKFDLRNTESHDETKIQPEKEKIKTHSIIESFESIILEIDKGLRTTNSKEKRLFHQWFQGLNLHGTISDVQFAPDLKQQERALFLLHAIHFRLQHFTTRREREQLASVTLKTIGAFIHRQNGYLNTEQWEELFTQISKQKYPQITLRSFVHNPLVIQAPNKQAIHLVYHQNSIAHHPDIKNLPKNENKMLFHNVMRLLQTGQMAKEHYKNTQQELEVLDQFLQKEILKSNTHMFFSLFAHLNAYTGAFSNEQATEQGFTPLTDDESRNVSVLLTKIHFQLQHSSSDKHQKRISQHFRNDIQTFLKQVKQPPSYEEWERIITSLDKAGFPFVSLPSLVQDSVLDVTTRKQIATIMFHKQEEKLHEQTESSTELLKNILLKVDKGLLTTDSKEKALFHQWLQKLNMHETISDIQFKTVVEQKQVFFLLHAIHFRLQHFTPQYMRKQRKQSVAEVLKTIGALIHRQNGYLNTEQWEELFTQISKQKYPQITLRSFVHNPLVSQAPNKQAVYLVYHQNNLAYHPDIKRLPKNENKMFFHNVMQLLQTGQMAREQYKNMQLELEVLDRFVQKELLKPNSLQFFSLFAHLNAYTGVFSKEQATEKGFTPLTEDESRNVSLLFTKIHFLLQHCSSDKHQKKISQHFRNHIQTFLKQVKQPLSYQEWERIVTSLDKAGFPFVSLQSMVQDSVIDVTTRKQIATMMSHKQAEKLRELIEISTELLKLANEAVDAQSYYDKNLKVLRLRTKQHHLEKSMDQFKTYSADKSNVSAQKQLYPLLHEAYYFFNHLVSDELTEKLAPAFTKNLSAFISKNNAFLTTDEWVRFITHLPSEENEKLTYTPWESMQRWLDAKVQDPKKNQLIDERWINTTNGTSQNHQQVQENMFQTHLRLKTLQKMGISFSGILKMEQITASFHPLALSQDFIKTSIRQLQKTYYKPTKDIMIYYGMILPCVEVIHGIQTNGHRQWDAAAYKNAMGAMRQMSELLVYLGGKSHDPLPTLQALSTHLQKNIEQRAFENKNCLIVMQRVDPQKKQQLFMQMKRVNLGFQKIIQTIKTQNHFNTNDSNKQKLIQDIEKIAKFFDPSLLLQSANINKINESVLRNNDPFSNERFSIQSHRKEELHKNR